MGLVLVCVHLSLSSSSKYTNLILRTDLHRVLKVEKARVRTKMQIELKYTLSRAVRLKIMMIKSFSFKNEFDQFFSFAIYLCFFRALLDIPAFTALDNRWCPYIHILCSPHGA